MPEKEKAYFVTMTVVDWMDVFTRKSYKLQMVDSLKYCQRMKGLEIYGWCLMTNHLHMIAKATGKQFMWEIIRDLKKFTARTICAAMLEPGESRREWMLAGFEKRGRPLKRISRFKFWKDGNHPIEIYSPYIFHQKLMYIHNNPVKEMIVEKPEDYLFSSARNYAGAESLLDVVLETPRLITVG